jgi:vesicular inhibitory amino acid transporter
MVPSTRGERLSTVIHDFNRNQLMNEVFYQDDVYSSFPAPSSRANSITASPIPITSKRVWPSQSFSSLRSAVSAATVASQFTLKKIEDKDGNVVTVVAGQSTAPQTIFNSINVLIGVGLLALPVGILKAGWGFGIPILLICGFATYWSATLISKSMDTDPTIMTYADLGYASYGSIAKLLISLIFCIDLVGSGISLIVLFSDSLYALLGDDVVWTPTRFKILSFFVLTPFTFMPLPILSIFSLLGIMATISITILVLVCGFLKPTAPGSLLQIMPSNMWPSSLPNLLIAIGILMAPFGGHAIFPNLKSDMRHPYKFSHTLKFTYSITLLTDFSMGLLGFLMFGHLCNNEITNNILLTPGYPKWCYPLISGLICLIPLAKTPLNAKPIIHTLDSIFRTHGYSDNWTTNGLMMVGRVTIRVGVNAIFVSLAILFPEFDKIIGVLGASICFLVCIILPVSFYMKLCKDQISLVERFFLRLVIAMSIFLGIVATFAVIHY